MLTILNRILRQILNDKRTLGLLLFAPLFVLTLLFFILGDSNYTPTIAIYNVSDNLKSEIEKDADIMELSEEPTSDSKLESSSYDAYFWADSDGMHVRALEKNTKSGAALKIIQESSQALLPAASKLDTSYVYETNEDNQLDSLSFVFLGVISFFFVFILSGMSFVRERFSQTLERTLMTPISRLQVIGGYTLGYGTFSALQSILIVLFSVYVLKLQLNGSVLLCILIMVLLAFAAVSMGALASIFSNNEMQIVQFIPIVIIPQIFYSGLIPLDTIPFGLGNLCYATPIYYGCTCLQKIIIYGKGFSEILPWMLGLLGYIGILFVINVFALKKYRRI